MKKLLLIAVLSLFVANAYALETKIYGEHQLGGVWLVNHNAGSDGEDGGPRNADASFFRQHLRIWAEISPEPGTTIVLRTTPADTPQRKFGGGANGPWGQGVMDGDTNLDRAWIQYAVTDSLTVIGGRMTGNNYSASGWGQGFFNGAFAESGGVDGFAAVYAIGDHKVTLGYVKAAEASNGFPGNGGFTNGRDADAYVAMADLKFGDLAINPRLTYLRDHTSANVSLDTGTVMGFYLDGQYKPAMGLNVIAAFAMATGSDVSSPYAFVAGEDMSVFGAHVDVSYKTDAFKAGIRGAFSSYDKEDGAFTLGGDYDKTNYIDDLFDERGVPAMNVVQLYGEIYMGDFTILPSFAYYMSNVDKDATVTSVGGNTAQAWVIGEDTTFMEFDLIGAYKLTDYTTLRAGYAAVMADGLGMNDAYDADMAHKLFWMVSTKF
jgi:hypothetical protein